MLTLQYIFGNEDTRKMTQEIKPTIVEKGQYKNIILRNDMKNDGDFFIFEKGDFADGMKNTGQGRGGPYEFYSCKVKVGGEEASFILYEQDHERFASIDAGAKCKITMREEKYETKAGKKGLATRYYFEKVE